MFLLQILNIVFKGGGLFKEQFLKKGTVVFEFIFWIDFSQFMHTRPEIIWSFSTQERAGLIIMFEVIMTGVIILVLNKSMLGCASYNELSPYYSK